jgi:processing peptidase subunit alpha
VSERERERAAAERMRSLTCRRLFSTAQVPPHLELPGIPKLQPFHEKAKPKTQVTTLANGLRVVSEETYRASSSLGLFVDAGSRFETDANNGVSHMLEHMAFKTTQNRSSLRVVRDVEEMGGNVGAASAREYMVFTADVIRTNLDRATELVAETAMKPKFAPWDIEDQRKILRIELEEMEKNAQAMVTEMMFQAAYTDSSPLGRPLYMPRRNIDKISAEQLLEFTNEHFHVNRMILAAAGVDHGELVEMAKKYFGSAKAGPAAKPVAPTKYVGGEQRLRAESPQTQVSISFEVGGWKTDHLLPVCVLHMLLGGGSSFSPGGPGKGMYSRLYMNLLNQHHWIDSATAFNSLHNDVGLLGIYGTCAPRDAGKLIDVMASELIDIASKTPTEEETTRAKNQLKSSILMNLDSTQILMEDIGRQVLVYGKREDPFSLCNKIDQVTPQQVQKAAATAISSPLTLVAFGDVSSVPSYDTVSRRFR